MNRSATIVLPVHNVERTLRPLLLRILELAETTARRLQLVVVDDGSTDGTYEAACELARQFPQVRVLRQPYQHGLRPALDAVRRRFGVENVIAHNGAGPVELEELESLLRAPAEPCVAGQSPSVDSRFAADRGSRRFGAVAKLSAGLTEPRGSAGAFRWLRLDDCTPRRMHAAPLAAAHIGSRLLPVEGGVGHHLAPLIGAP